MPADNEHFGRSLTSDGVKWLAIAATGWQSIGSDTRGAVFVYAYNASNASSPRWEYRQMINSSMSSHFFGNAIAMSGQTLVVGSSAEDVDGTVLNQGAVYIYELGTNGVSWNLKERLVAHDGSASDFFGHALDIRGNNMLIGAHHDDNANGVTNPGAVYFIQRNETSWVHKQKILLPHRVLAVLWCCNSDVDGRHDGDYWRYGGCHGIRECLHLLIQFLRSIMVSSTPLGKSE